jgi:predicted RNase H-like nuclease (RuvC/YqgF family)
MSEDSNKENENEDKNKEGENKEEKKQDVDIASIIEDNKRMKSKLNELLDETKGAKKKAREEAERAEELARQKALKDGDYEQLLKSSEEKNKTLNEKLQQIETAREREIIKNTSLALSAEIAEGTSIELLSVFASKRIKIVDGEIKVLDEKGNLTVSTLDDLKNEFLRSDKFKPLLKGSKATGGGAAGAGGGAPSKKSISRTDFKKLGSIDKAKFFKDGGTVFDE